MPEIEVPEGDTRVDAVVRRGDSVRGGGLLISTRC